MPKSSFSISDLTKTALLIAMGILIPIMMPLKLVIEPASFTLGSHIAIFLAMFISPFAAISVVIGSTIGFAVGGFPPVVVARSASHIIFAIIGSYYLQSHPQVLNKALPAQTFSFIMALIHAVGEVLTVTIIYFVVGNISFDSSKFIYLVVVLVGLGTIIHSMVDFIFAFVIGKAVRLLPMKGKTKF